MGKVPSQELQERMFRFKNEMNASNPDWEIAFIFSKVNLYYFTGTMPDGMLIIPRDDEAALWVRRGFERAVLESEFETIKRMKSFRVASNYFQKLPETVYLETERVTLSLYSLFHKYFPFKNLKSLDRVLASVRAVKSEYELNLMRSSGKIHSYVLEDLVPEILKEGISEAELGAELFKILISEGHHGVTRFGMFDTEMLLGHIGFGESSIYPSNFNGASGNRGLSPAVPLLGSRERRLKKGDLVYIDVGCGVDGYNTDKTMTYMFGARLPEHAIEAHEVCVEVQNKIAKMLRPGALPSNIYRAILDGLDSDFLENFMGFGSHRVNFLGHGIGLLIDETPVIAENFSEPIREGMVFAVEPKKGIEGVGMVGIENTFIVTPRGGECITGSSTGLIPVL